MTIWDTFDVWTGTLGTFERFDVGWDKVVGMVIEDETGTEG